MSYWDKDSQDSPSNEDYSLNEDYKLNDSPSNEELNVGGGNVDASGDAHGANEDEDKKANIKDKEVVIDKEVDMDNEVDNIMYSDGEIGSTQPEETLSIIRANGAADENNHNDECMDDHKQEYVDNQKEEHVDDKKEKSDDNVNDNRPNRVDLKKIKWDEQGIGEYIDERGMVVYICKDEINGEFQ
eukprot:8504_1